MFDKENRCHRDGSLFLGKNTVMSLRRRSGVAEAVLYTMDFTETGSVKDIWLK